MQYFSLISILAIFTSVYYLFKKPQKVRNLSMAMFIPLLVFCVMAFFGNSLAKYNSDLFWKSFGALTIYCITIVPVLMHLSSAIRQRLKLEKQDEQSKN